jgi:hypothetical protein
MKCIYCKREDVSWYECERPECEPYEAIRSFVPLYQYGICHECGEMYRRTYSLKLMDLKHSSGDEVWHRMDLTEPNE